ncbi:hypothetical protein Agub_g14687 [Astrephomene gubernaculifera]|uniref:Uncharacterized protein n=1 Tax=Astrephomene gubernaculifera TaxID=47775 RepID=A0AAD3E5X8_9CHLO|nr:hypothetical protein Agub_g14687 [Astrephomene gubernaculifera]
MSSQRPIGTASSSRATPSSSSPSSLATRPPRVASTPAKDAGRATSGTANSVNGRTGTHASASARSSAAAAAAAASASAAAAGGDVDGGEELVAQLQERLQQLEAEYKASQDTAQWTIKQNKNTLLALKQENKDLSAEVARRGGSTELQCKTGTATDGEKVIERLERQVHELRRAYDKVVKDKKTALQKLDNLHDSLKDMAKVSAAAASAAAATSAVNASSSAANGAAGGVNASLASAASTAAIAAAAAALPPSSPAARELRQLQNRLDKAVVKANEAYSIRKTYEQVVEKLRSEEPLLEARIRGLEEQRATKQAALQAITLTARDVHSAKDSAKAALVALEAEVAGNRGRRARVLAEMRDKASTLQQTNRALLQRQFQPLTTAASPSTSASLDLESSAALTAASSNHHHHLHAKALRPSPDAVSSDTHVSEEADITARDLVIQLCRTTGSRRVSELLARLLAQQESYKGLLEMRSQAAAQRLALVQELEVLRSHRDEMRDGGKMSTQKQMDAAQEELRAATARAEAASEVLDCLLRGVAAVRGGLAHLATMTAPLPLPAGAAAGGQPPLLALAGASGGGAGGGGQLEDESLGEVLAQVETRLVGAYRLITSLPKAVDLLESQYAAIKNE